MDTTRTAASQRTLTDELTASPYDARLYLARGGLYEKLRLHDLAAGDAYKALLLTDEIEDESGEYHERACQALGPASVDDDGALARELSGAAYQLLVKNLFNCGCLRPAYTFSVRGLTVDPGDSVLAELRDRIAGQVTTNGSKLTADEIETLPKRTSVRAQLYEWNDHEPDRFAPANLDQLSGALGAVAPKLHVRATELPVLPRGRGTAESGATVRQLGLFAAADLAPGELILQERSLLVAGISAEEPLCDCCGDALPLVSVGGGDGTLADDGGGAIACPECEEAVFCGERCFRLATESYHAVVCDKGVETVARETPPVEAADALYLLLLARAIALAEARGQHLLDLEEVRYLWGDFVAERCPSDADEGPPTGKLPFSFQYNILFPLNMLEKMDVDTFAAVDKYDFWAIQTAYAKFRAVANGRVNQRTGRPELCAVSPMWCLANHSCAPNVRWEWGGEVKLWARQDDERKIWSDGSALPYTGIKEGEEILNHYCDVELDVESRREWMMGPLGGVCMCSRCVSESNGKAQEIASNTPS